MLSAFGNIIFAICRYLLLNKIANIRPPAVACRWKTGIDDHKSSSSSITFTMNIERLILLQQLTCYKFGLVRNVSATFINTFTQEYL